MNCQNFSVKEIVLKYDVSDVFQYRKPNMNCQNFSVKEIVLKYDVSDVFQ